MVTKKDRKRVLERIKTGYCVPPTNSWSRTPYASEVVEIKPKGKKSKGKKRK